MAKSASKSSPAASQPVKKAKSTASWSAKKLTHVEMVETAVESSRDRRGMTRQALATFLLDEFGLDQSESRVKTNVKRAIANAIENGIIEQKVLGRYTLVLEGQEQSPEPKKSKTQSKKKTKDTAKSAAPKQKKK